MAIIVRCACGKQLKAPDKLRGTQAKCPACGKPVIIAAADDDPSAVAELVAPPSADAINESHTHPEASGLENHPTENSANDVVQNRTLVGESGHTPVEFLPESLNDGWASPTTDKSSELDWNSPPEPQSTSTNAPVPPPLPMQAEDSQVASGTLFRAVEQQTDRLERQGAALLQEMQFQSDHLKSLRRMAKFWTVVLVVSMVLGVIYAIIWEFNSLPEIEKVHAIIGTLFLAGVITVLIYFFQSPTARKGNDRKRSRHAYRSNDKSNGAEFFEDRQPSNAPNRL